MFCEIYICYNNYIIMEDIYHKYIKKDKEELIKKFTKNIKKDDAPLIIFMAGSPGAGKTEISKRLMMKFKNQPIRIDADEIRLLFEEYSGNNSESFQKAANKGVNILYDYSINNNLNIILDATFAYNDAIKNVSRALKHGYKVEIYFIYQNPEDSWYFTKVREKIEKRYVPKEIFIKGFLNSFINVKKVKEIFGNKIKLSLISKDYKTDLEEIYLNIDNIDNYLKLNYTEKSLYDIINI